jgi:UDP-2,3-diacylglucosamine hydrolase
MNATVPRNTVHGVASSASLLTAPADWQCIDFIADLHLQAGDSATFSAWQDFMQRTRADAVFILGDLFEIWVGDDVLNDDNLAGPVIEADPGPGFARRCAQVLEAASRRLRLYFMHGNRDFLLGPVYAGACGMTLLDDPSVIDFGGRRWLLSHGDALCLQDTDYMRFRAKVRSAQWRQAFLAKPLAERQLIGRELRAQSEAHKRNCLASGEVLFDLDMEETRNWLRTAQASTLIHGHTHKPAEHDLGNGRRRIVLSDWDASAIPARGSVLRLHQTSGNCAVQRLATTLV